MTNTRHREPEDYFAPGGFSQVAIF